MEAEDGEKGLMLSKGRRGSIERRIYLEDPKTRGENQTMKKAKKALVSLAIAGMTLTIVPFNVFASTGVTTDRLQGATRIGTANAVAQ